MIRLEIREVLWELRKEVREVREQGKRAREELEELRKEFREQIKEGRKEKDRVRGELEKMEGRIKEIEKGREKGKDSVDRGGRDESKEVRDRLKGIERKIELREREKRKRNVIIKGLKVEGEERRSKVEELMSDIGVKVDIVETKKIGEDREKGREMVWVRLRDEEQRGEIFETKRRLKGRKERIGEDLTWRERKMKWKIEEIAREEVKEGRRVWKVRYGRIRIDNTW